MKIQVLLFLPLFLLFSCNKQTVKESAPVMQYKDLKDLRVSLNQSDTPIDVDGNGKDDLYFAVVVTYNPTNLISEKQAQLFTVAGTFIPVKSQIEVPVLGYGDNISTNAFPGYQWNNAWLSVLAKKSLGASDSLWTGNWKDISHKYIPFTIEKAAQVVYFGWIEISFDSATETIILRKCAISTESNKAIQAGS